MTTIGRRDPFTVPAPAASQGISTEDARAFAETGQLPDLVGADGETVARGEERFARIVEAAADEGSWKAEDSVTFLVSLRRAELASRAQFLEERGELTETAELLRAADKDLGRGLQALYADATRAREKHSTKLLARASALETQAAHAREKGLRPRAEELEARAGKLRDRGARLAYEEAQYRASVPRAGFDAAHAYHLAAAAQIARGRSELGAMLRDQKTALPAEPPAVLGDADAAATPNQVPGAARLLRAAGGENMALEGDRANALASFHREHLLRGRYFDAAAPAPSAALIAHRERYLDARAGEAIAIGRRVELLGASGVDALEAARLEGDRRAIDVELAGALAHSMASDRALDAAHARTGALEQELAGATSAEKEAKSRAEASREEEERVRSAAGAILGDTLKTAGEARRDRESVADAAAIHASDQSVARFATRRREATESALGSARVDERARALESARAGADAALVNKAVARLAPNTAPANKSEAYAAARALADRSAVNGAAHLDRAEQTLSAHDRRAARAELDSARIELARYWTGSAELDDSRPAALDRLHTSAALIDRAEHAPNAIDARAELGEALAAYRPGEARDQLARAEALAGNDPAARERIGAAAANALVRQDLSFEAILHEGGHAPGAGDALYLQAHRLIGGSKNESLEQIDGALDAAGEMISAAGVQLENGQAYAEQQARAIGRADLAAKQAQISTVISGGTWLLTFGQFDMKERLAASSEAQASGLVDAGRALTDRQTRSAVQLGAAFAGARAEGRPIEMLHSLRIRADQTDKPPLQGQVPVARALAGPLLGYGEARDRLGSRDLAVVTGSMQSLMIDTQADSVRDTTKHVGLIVAANTGLEVALGLVATGGVGSAGAIAKAGSVSNAARVVRAVGTAAAAGTAMTAASYGVKKLAGANTGVSHGFDTMMSFAPLAAEQRAAGHVFAAAPALGGAQAFAVTLAAPEVSDALGVKSELGQAAVGVGLAAALAGGTAYASGRFAEHAPEVAGPDVVEAAPSSGIFGGIFGKQKTWTADQHRSQFLANYPEGAPLAGLTADEFVRAFGEGPYPEKVAKMAGEPGFVALAKTDPARARVLLQASYAGFKVRDPIAAYGAAKAADILEPMLPRVRDLGGNYRAVEPAPLGAEGKPALHIQTTAALDHNGAFHEKAGSAVSDISRLLAPRPGQMIGRDGKPLADLRKVAVLSTHGGRLGYEGLGTEKAAELLAKELADANDARGPNDRLEYVMLDSCMQGDHRFMFFGESNAQVLQRMLNEKLAARGYQLAGAPITVLAADKPGPLYGGAMDPKQREPARYVPAQDQKPGVSIDKWDALLLAEGTALVAGTAYAAYRVIEIDPKRDRSRPAPPRADGARR